MPKSTTWISATSPAAKERTTQPEGAKLPSPTPTNNLVQGRNCSGGTEKMVNFFGYEHAPVPEEPRETPSHERPRESGIQNLPG